MLGNMKSSHFVSLGILASYFTVILCLFALIVGDLRKLAVLSNASVPKIVTFIGLTAVSFGYTWYCKFYNVFSCSAHYFIIDMFRYMAVSVC